MCFFFPPFSLRVFFFTDEENLKTGAPINGDRSPGDWVRMGDREHGAKGLCQERALVSGLEVGVFGYPNLEGNMGSKPGGW